MKVTWIGHSCFKVESNGYTIVIDPYAAGSVPGLRPVNVTADQVLCSHEHSDHNGRDEVSLTGREETESPFKVEILPTWHDEVHGAKRGNNRIFVISDGEQRIAHFGDLGCDLTEEQMEALKGLDVALIPVGGFYTIDGNQAAEVIRALNPKIVIPMHFRDDQAGFGYGEIDTVKTFAEKMESLTVVAESTIDTADQFGTQVVVLQPLNNI
ncbi:MAG: MBL fold metallo-hydrolase [Eubacteriales bacterium]|nr:MBL fold metallo-hydrolase [Eubacteriales bacterium]